MDEIMLMDSGTIVEKGTFEDLKANKDGPFNDFMRLFFESKLDRSVASTQDIS